MLSKAVKHHRLQRHNEKPFLHVQSFCLIYVTHREGPFEAQPFDAKSEISNSRLSSMLCYYCSISIKVHTHYPLTGCGYPGLKTYPHPLLLDFELQPPSDSRHDITNTWSCPAKLQKAERQVIHVSACFEPCAKSPHVAVPAIVRAVRYGADRRGKILCMKINIF